MIEEGTKICITLWKKDLYIMKKSWVDRKEQIRVIGLPHYLWPVRNNEILGEVFGNGLVEVDKECLEFTRMD